MNATSVSLKVALALTLSTLSVISHCLAQTDLRVQPIPLLTITGPENTTNQVQYTTSLATSNDWRVLTNVVLTGSNATVVDIAAAGTTRFYRIVTLGGGTNGHPPTPQNFVWIPPGTFTMGSPVEELGHGLNESPQTTVTLSRGFFMGKFEVTQREYAEVVGENPSYFLGDSNRPVEYVRWNDATNYCGKLTARELGAGRLISGFRYRLPTEAEWEYACRGGTVTRFSFGDDPLSRNIGDYAWISSNSSNVTHAVGLKFPNQWGLYDMHGNVGEWCSDWLGAYPGGSVVDPQGAATGTHKLLRGGYYSLQNTTDCRSAYRGTGLPSLYFTAAGFRVVLAPE